MIEYVEHPFARLAEWPSAALEAGWSAHVAASLRAMAIERGQSLAGEPELVKTADGPPADTDDGPKKTYIETWRAPIEQASGLTTETVEAQETALGVWMADVPPDVVIVNVKHGLGSLNVDVSGLDADGWPCGYRSFVPISLGEVEVVPSTVTRRVAITLVLDDEEAEGGEHRPDAQSPRQVDA